MTDLAPVIGPSEMKHPGLFVAWASRPCYWGPWDRQSPDWPLSRKLLGRATVRTDTVCHLCDSAMRLGRKLRWDPTVEQFINPAAPLRVGDAEANRLLIRPWHL